MTARTEPRTRASRGGPQVFLSIALPILVPVVVVIVLFVHHLVTFDGTCGPYAPDIESFPCDLGEYAQNFFSPFALVGLLALCATLFAGTGALVLVYWLLRGLWTKAKGRS